MCALCCMSRRAYGDTTNANLAWTRRLGFRGLSVGPAPTAEISILTALRTMPPPGRVLHPAYNTGQPCRVGPLRLRDIHLQSSPSAPSPSKSRTWPVLGKVATVALCCRG